MDIPFMGVVIGWRNYKMIAKKELRKVPILGKAIQVGGHVMVDRSSRKSQLKTLKDGIAHLKNGVHLCTFPEGTRSKSGRLHAFKNGAFKMAQKAGAPVVPLSICNAHKVNPPYWIFPFIASHGVAKVVVHAPIESIGKTEEELAEAVRLAMISGLPEDQKPLPASVPSPPIKKVTVAATTLDDEKTDVSMVETKMEISLETTTAPSAAVAHRNGDDGSSSSAEDDMSPLRETIHMEEASLETAKMAATTPIISELQPEEKTA
jgi:1-acyl-sn-glycerol-3-phosphate acyltransferase